ncbi:MAG: glycosyltransferase family 4 protein [Myxococcota bacterium]
MNVLFDTSILGAAYRSHRARTGIFRATEHLLLALAESGQCVLRLCATRHQADSLEYWQSQPGLARLVPFPNRGPSSGRIRRQVPLKRQLARFYYAHQDNPWIRLPFRFGAALPMYADQMIDRWLDRRVWRDNLRFADIYHAPHFEWLPDLGRARRFVTLHDLIPIKFPQLFSGREAAKLRNLLDRLRPDDWILCSSEATRQDLLTYFDGRGPAPRSRVVPLAADSGTFHPVRDPALLEKIRLEYGLDQRPYILALGTLEPRKNLSTLIRAFSTLCDDTGADAQLVIVGPKGWHLAPFMEEIQRVRRLGDRIVLTGFAPDEDLAALYSGAAVFAFPSLYEGFGLPVLEAMQCGTPVITSRGSSLPDLVGDAGLLIDPTDPDELAQALADVLLNAPLRAQLSERCIQRSAAFSWARSAEATLTAYRESLPRR